MSEETAAFPRLSRHGLRPDPWIVAPLLLTAALVMLAVFHVGFQASDDINYVVGALGWLAGFPYVGDSHWTLRHTVTLPAALSIHVQGMTERAVSMSNMAYFLGFLVVNAVHLRRHLGGACAAVATVLLLAAPGFPVVATYLNPDVPELFFVCCAFWLLIGSLQRPGNMGLWLGCGALAGLAFVNRQTAASFVLFVGLLWLLRPGVPRPRYLTALAAMLLVVLGEWLYLTLATGDPLYRWQVDFHHDPVDRFAAAAKVAAEGRWIDKEGNLAINVWVDPFVSLFVSQKYTLLFWLAVPGVWWAWRGGAARAASRTVLLAAGLGAVSFVFIAANPKLYLVPRYFMIAAWAASIAAAWWIVQLWQEGRHRLAGLAVAGAVLVGGLAYAVENVDPRSTERLLVEWVADHPGQTIHTDIETAARAEFFFRFRGISTAGVSTAAPPAGSRFLHSARRVEECASTRRCRDRVGDFRPGPQWQPIATLLGPRRPVARLAAALRADRVLPADIARRLMAPTAEVTVYEVR